MTTLTERIPLPEGGTRFGSTFITTWWTCPMKWANTYIRPHPTEGGHGMSSVDTPPPLGVGTAVHEALEAYYNHKTHEEIFKAIDDAIEDTEWVDPQTKLRAGEEATKLMAEYLEHSVHDVEQFDAYIHPKHGVMIERELSVPLGYKDYVVTSKPDMVVVMHDSGRLRCMEHKTVAVSRLWARKAELRCGVQGAIEIMACRHHDMDIEGVWLNAIPKGRGKKSTAPPIDRQELITHSDMELNKFKHDIVQTLQEIEDAVAMYDELVADGRTDQDAAFAAFRKNRTQCVVFGRCSFYTPCSAPLHETQLLTGGYRARKPKTQEEVADAD